MALGATGSSTRRSPVRVYTVVPPLIETYLETLDHEELLRPARADARACTAIVAVHSTVRGPSLGGCRMWSYDDSRAAVRDALRLSRAMTLKAAVADLALGGGKGVIMAPLGAPLSLPPPPARRAAGLRRHRAVAAAAATSPPRTSEPRAGT